MYIRRIILENVRGFQSLDFTFEHANNTYCGWNVITGDNGSGKTALLRAIALALIGPESARVLQPNPQGWIRRPFKGATIAAQLVAGPIDRFTGGRRFDKPFWSEIELNSDSKGQVTLKRGQTYLKGKLGPSRGPWLDQAEGWFCVGYGPFRRLYGHSPEAQRLMSTRGKISRFATLFREDATLAEGDLWLRDLRYRGLEGDILARETLDTVLKLFNYDFFQSEIEVETVTSDGLMLRHPNGPTLPLEQMSDGYRSAIAMLIDIVRQLMDVYGPDGFALSNNMRIEHTGVVLVDEIDAHLHPSWQRAIGEWFKKILPNMQFIVTSHSPLICQAASDMGIYHLPAPDSDMAPFQLAALDYQRVIAGRPNEIYLSPAFGLSHTWSPKAVSARDQYARLQAQKQVRTLNQAEIQTERQLSLFVFPQSKDEEDPSTPT